MKTTNTNKNILAALLITSTLVASGYAQTTAPAPTVMETQFQHNIGADHIQNAVIAAATDNGWEIIQKDANKLLLKKSISFKETAKNTRGRTWNKVTVNKDAVASVDLTDNSYALKLDEASQKYLKDYYSEKVLSKDLKTLKNAIHCAMIPEAL